MRRESSKQRKLLIMVILKMLSGFKKRFLSTDTVVIDVVIDVFFGTMVVFDYSVDSGIDSVSADQFLVKAYDKEKWLF